MSISPFFKIKIAIDALFCSELNAAMCYALRMSIY